MDKFVLPLSAGVGVIDGNRLCVSVIDNGGDKKVGGQTIGYNQRLTDNVFLRSFAYFFYCVWFYFKAIFLQDELVESAGAKSKKQKQTERISIGSRYILLVAFLLAVFVYAFLVVGICPSAIFGYLFPYNSDYYFRAFMIALFRTGLLYLFFAILRFCPFMFSLYAFNGAGNQFMIDKTGKLCDISYPLNFLNLALNISVFSTFVISLVAANVSFLANMFINLGIFLSTIPLCYEFLRYASKGKNRWIKNVCLVTNWLVVICPKTTHNEVITVAKQEMKNFDDFEVSDKGMVSMSALFAQMKTKLEGGGEESDIDWIIATVLDKNRAEIKLQRFVTQKQAREIMRACERRAKGEPLSNIFGFVEFYGLRFSVNKKVLTPRMDTEVMVEAVINKAKEIDAKNILDLCTGSGAIAVTLAKNTDCKIFASDISKQALAVAEENAKENNARVEFCQSDLTKGLKKNKKYDIIVSNPPYIKSGDIEKLDGEVKNYDPKLALDGGEDGLDFYRRIAVEAADKLSKKGWLYLEIGKGQEKDVCRLLEENGFENIQTIKDYNKIERVVYGRTSK